jgi:hypothetical protein
MLGRFDLCGKSNPDLRCRTCEISDALLVGKKPEATRHQAMVLQAAILAALRARNGVAVIGDGPRGKWRLKEAAN